MKVMNRVALKVALAGQGKTLWSLAIDLGFRPSTFSDYVRGVAPVPSGVIERVEQALQIPAGSLVVNRAEREPSPPAKRSARASRTGAVLPSPRANGSGPSMPSAQVKS